MVTNTDRLTARRLRGVAVGLALIVVGAFILAGCGSAASSAASGALKVTLTEWAVVLDTASVPAGDVKFEVTNAGTQFKHEFVVIKSDLAPADLPADATGKVDEEGSGLTFVGEVEQLAIGATESASFNLTAGKYIIICNIVETTAGHESHYNKGMRTAFTVT